MTKYQLTCSCGQILVVETSQAGQTAQCVCGVELEIPPFREIRQLPLADVTESPRASRKPAKKWSIARGLLYAVGLAIAVFGLGMAGYFQWGRSRLSTEENTAWDNLDESLATIDQFSLFDSIALWEFFEETGIGEYRPPRYIVHRMWSAHWLMMVQIGLSVAAVGGLLLGAAYLIPQPSARPRRQPPPRSP